MQPHKPLHGKRELPHDAKVMSFVLLRSKPCILQESPQCVVVVNFIVEEHDAFHQIKNAIKKKTVTMEEMNTTAMVSHSMSFRFNFF